MNVDLYKLELRGWVIPPADLWEAACLSLSPDRLRALQREVPEGSEPTPEQICRFVQE